MNGTVNEHNFEMMSDAEDQELSEKDQSRPISSNRLGATGEEIFILTDSSQVSLIINGDKNEFIDRSSELTVGKGNSARIDSLDGGLSELETVLKAQESSFFTDAKRSQEYSILLEFSQLFKKTFFIGNNLQTSNERTQKIYIEKNAKTVPKLENMGRPEEGTEQNSISQFVDYLSGGVWNELSSTNFSLHLDLFMRARNTSGDPTDVDSVLRSHFREVDARKSEEAYENLLLFLVEHEQPIRKFFGRLAKTQHLLFLGFPELLYLNSCVLDSRISAESPNKLSLNVPALTNQLINRHAASKPIS